MPKKNKFSGLYEPDKDTCTESGEENIQRFREATLKLDRIHNDENEQGIVEDLYITAIKYNKSKIQLKQETDYVEAIEQLEDVYNDVDANHMILEIERIAQQYGYVPEMDETVDVDNEMFYCATETMPALLARIQTEYASVSTYVKKHLLNKIAGGMRSYEIERDNPRLPAHRAEIWKIEIPIGIGNETNGYRWVIIISNKNHARYSNTVNVVYLDGSTDGVINEESQMEIKNEDLNYGVLEKEPSRINITDICTIDKKRLMERKGKVCGEFMGRLMERIAKQLGIKLK